MEFIFAWLIFYFWWTGRRPAAPPDPPPVHTGAVLSPGKPVWEATVRQGRSTKVWVTAADTEEEAVLNFLRMGVDPKGFTDVKLRKTP